MIVGDLGKAHRIHAAVNNHQAKHQSTVLETLGMISDQQFSIALKIIKVKEVEQDEFRYVELASGAKQKVGGKVKYCNY
jgi:hypothetical protein